jgi:hypothetical protein
VDVEDITENPVPSDNTGFVSVKSVVFLFLFVHLPVNVLQNVRVQLHERATRNATPDLLETGYLDAAWDEAIRDLCHLHTQVSNSAVECVVEKVIST